MTVHLLFHGRDKSASFLFAFDLSPLRLLPIKAAQLLQHLRHWYRRLLELKLSIRLAPFGLVALIKQALEARSIKIRAFYVTIDIKCRWNNMDQPLFQKCQWNGRSLEEL
ncbi:hypothetical protein E1B28_002952 [Marasmius oreades]|uniref:Uncharacterized protein n=1 Tax=Marasmius oreades TaxID=181124 RepID=A0A9P7RKA1_9AGAR|nr:uncharacterized protein E1B28_002952 [Marasmius oreades]KAG7085389.1 hypothetical protein E1B28_002952 [Marasmius oreades]